MAANPRGGRVVIGKISGLPGDPGEALAVALEPWGIMLDLRLEYVPGSNKKHLTGNASFLLGLTKAGEYPPPTLEIIRGEHDCKLCTLRLKLPKGDVLCCFCHGQHTRPLCQTAPFCNVCGETRAHAPYNCPKGRRAASASQSRSTVVPSKRARNGPSATAPCAPQSVSLSEHYL